MRKLGGGSLFVVAIALVLAGLALRSGWVDWIIGAAGYLVIGGGVIAGIMGLISMFTGGGKKTADF